MLTEAIDKSADNITAGDSLAAPLAACKYFPRDVVEMVAVGEESNNLEKVLIDIANGLEKRTARSWSCSSACWSRSCCWSWRASSCWSWPGLLLPVFKMSSAVQ